MQLPWAQLEVMLDKLTSDYTQGKLDITRYVDEWDDLIEFAGWTWEQFADEVNKRWSPEKKQVIQLFEC